MAISVVLGINAGESNSKGSIYCPLKDPGSKNHTWCRLWNQLESLKKQYMDPLGIRFGWLLHGSLSGTAAPRIKMSSVSPRSWLLSYPEGPSSQYLRTLVPKTILGTGTLWVGAYRRSPCSPQLWTLLVQRSHTTKSLSTIFLPQKLHVAVDGICTHIGLEGIPYHRFRQVNLYIMNLQHAFGFRAAAQVRAQDLRCLHPQRGFEKAPQPQDFGSFKRRPALVPRGPSHTRLNLSPKPVSSAWSVIIRGSRM